MINTPQGALRKPKSSDGMFACLDALTVSVSHKSGEKSDFWVARVSPPA
jgi:hypothetical protein